MKSLFLNCILYLLRSSLSCIKICLLIWNVWQICKKERYQEGGKNIFMTRYIRWSQHWKKYLISPQHWQLNSCVWSELFRVIKLSSISLQVFQLGLGKRLILMPYMPFMVILSPRFSPELLLSGTIHQFYSNTPSNLATKRWIKSKSKRITANSRLTFVLKIKPTLLRSQFASWAFIKTSVSPREEM